mmetsp:Transcript_2156/g.4995  ORF Transcript_2156/g.4995 Transcript_2156/m.4995 type:complete len:305 (-) Transcript_2156:77-991(-)
MNFPFECLTRDQKTRCDARAQFSGRNMSASPSLTACRTAATVSSRDNASTISSWLPLEPWPLAKVTLSFDALPDSVVSETAISNLPLWHADTRSSALVSSYLPSTAPFRALRKNLPLVPLSPAAALARSIPTPPSDDAIFNLLRLGAFGALASGCGLDGAGAGLISEATGSIPAARASAARKAAALLSSIGGPLAFFRAAGFLAGAARFFSMPRSAALFVVTSLSFAAASSALGGKPPASSKPALQRKSVAARSAKLCMVSFGSMLPKVFVAPFTVMRRDQSSAIFAALVVSVSRFRCDGVRVG